jgi:two-component system, chemotaxis family, sensor kinase CheA
MIDTEILQDYASEARELLDEMDNSLMRLEREGSSPELLNNIFRAVHCIKGSAEYIGLERSSTLTHGVENLLDRLREGVLRVDPPIVEFLFRAKDLILTLIAEVSKEHEEKTTISAMMDQLEVFLTRPAIGAEGPEPETKEEAAPAIEAEPAEMTAEPEEPVVTEELPSAVTEELFSAAAEEIEEIGEAQKPVESIFFTVDNLGEDEEEEPSVQISPLIMDDFDDVAAETAEEALAAAMEEEPTELPIPDQMTTTSEARPAQSIEETVPSLLNMSLYLDDLQDGLYPGDIVRSLTETVYELTRSMEFLGLSDAVGILKVFEERVGSIDASTETLSREEIDELRSLLFSLRPFYPEGVIPWKQPSSQSQEPASAPTEELTREEPSVSSELAKIPGIDESVAAAVEAAGYASMDDLSRADLATLAKVPGVDHAAAEIILKYLGVITSAADWRRPARKPGERSLLADVDDELLREFEGIFGEDREPQAAFPMTATTNRAQDLLEELDSIGEEVDREIMEIFLSYGWEIMEKLRPYVQKIRDKTADNNDLDSCAELIKSIRSSSTYMDYQNLAAFLDEWFEKTVWCSEHIDSIDTQDFSFMEESLLRFQDFMRGLEFMLHPDSAAQLEALAPESLPETRPTPTPVETEVPPKAKPKHVDRVRVSTVVAAGEAKLESRPRQVAQASSKPETTVEIPTEEYVAQTAAKIKEAQQKATAERVLALDSPELATQDVGVMRESPESAVVKTMRVDSGKVDILLNQVGELVVNRSYVEQLALELKNFHRAIATAREIGKKEIQSIKDLSLKVGEASISLGRVATDLQEGVMKLRMLPVGQLFNRMPRLIRDLSRRVGKSVTLDLHGGDTEVDKRVIEQIYNPLVHLIRNAVDHGIEDKETRKKLGKSEEGSITLTAYSQGNQVVIDVEDDGGGINSTEVVEKAVENRLLDPQDAKGLGTQEMYNLLFLPGFSTSKKVTRTSGRGVGMDVVKKDVEKINGHVEIESWQNQGTRISIKIPLTLAIIQTLLIRSSKHTFAVPLTSVREIIQVSPREIITIEGFEVIKFRHETIPVLRISEVFKLKDADTSKHPRFLVLAAAGLKTVGFLVEELIGEQDVVIKPLAEHVCESRGLAGSTILGDGTIALVLDVLEVIEDVIAQQRQLAQSMPKHRAQENRIDELHDAWDI